MPANFLDDPYWYKDAVIYELHVRSFFDANNDGYGDFAGLREKLPYLESLGVNTLWLLPFLESPLRDDGYDIADYYRVLPVHGDLHDVRAFMEEANDRGMRVITELVLNHTSDQHPWFQEARDPSSEKHDWYVWSETTDKYEDARIIFTDTEVSNWSWDQKAQKYYWHRFFSHQPDLNYDNPAVREAMKRVMFFWFDMGVDGLRLDAVPYLFEREGTNCENLPETLDYIKELRTAVDERYGPGKVLLAEANQWPEDTLPYFGEETEDEDGNVRSTGVQMAFNFPIMPRMFMSLRRENRRPLVEMLELTKDIPPDTQWALFLRNHDELTLEMVTDEERDYMYHEYAADSRFRINVGIRRRLAPLLGGDRQRIELMNALLLSLQGSPVLYYGDEIGMGDDPFLGDRNGVRTPMQWSPDKHGGFSRAPIQRLFLPPITKGRYGYETVNVEDAEGDPYSLLAFTRRILSLRRQHVKVFGRGSLTVLPVENEAIFAFVRAYEGEKILVIVNLSRFPQSAYLPAHDMLSGLVPVELRGQTPFPQIEEGTPYHLVLGSHAWHWFVLKTEADVDKPHDALIEHPERAPEPLADLPRLQVTEGIQNLLVRTLVENGGMARLEGLLPAFLKQQRWFGGKGKQINEVSIADAVRIRREPRVYLTILKVTYDDGNVERYLVPFTQVFGNEIEVVQESSPEASLALVEGPDGTGMLIDATAWDDFWLILFEWWQREATSRSLRGQYVSKLDQPLRTVGAENAQPLRGDQSNSSAIIDRRYYIKLYRRLVAGQNPEAELLQHLTKQNFEFIPQLHGLLYFRRPDMQIDIGILQEALPVETDGWTYARAVIGRFLDRAAEVPAPPESPLADTEEGPPVVLDELAPEMLRLADTLGVRTAEMHQALAKGEGPDLSPIPGHPKDAKTLAARLEKEASETRALLDANVDLSAFEPLSWEGLQAGLTKVSNSRMNAQRIRIHGDYHLGQTIRATGELYILDFEGEPARPLDERRSRDYALRDVAGMLRSFDYAIHVAWAERTGKDPALKPWARLLSRWVEQSFVTAYNSATTEAPFLFPPGDRPVMQWAFLLEKALYEVRYELAHRPKWLWMPLHGLRKLLTSQAEPVSPIRAEASDRVSN